MLKIKYGSESPHWKGGKIKRVCLTCSKLFSVDPNVVVKGYGKFCSRSCTGKRAYGRKPKAARLYFKCLICSKEFSDYKSKVLKESNRGKCCSKICRVKYTQQEISGSKNYAWKGGITKINALERAHMATRNWASAIKNRDNFTCQKCHKRGGRLNSHHIKHWKTNPELKHDLNNGITLCVTCHKLEHKKK